MAPPSGIACVAPDRRIPAGFTNASRIAIRRTPKLSEEAHDELTAGSQSAWDDPLEQTLDVRPSTKAAPTISPFI